MAEREGFEPPIGLHLCRISSAVHSTTLPPLQAIELLDKSWAMVRSKSAFATALLPNVFGALLYSDLKGLVNARSGVLLHARQDVAVEVEGDPDLAWPSRSLATFGCTPAASMCVAWACRRSWNGCAGDGVARDSPHLREASRLHRLAVLTGVDKGRVRLPYAKSQ